MLTLDDQATRDVALSDPTVAGLILLVVINEAR